MKLKQVTMPKAQYKYKCPYSMTPEFIIIHNTSNDAKAANEIAYMVRNTNYTSFHIAVDDVEAIQAIPFNRNSFSAGDGGNGRGNRKGIAIEICYSKSGGARFTKAEINAAKVTANILKQYGWGINKVTKHQDYSGKFCPHRTLNLGWQRWLNLVSKELGNNTGLTTGGNTVSNVYYGIGSRHNNRSSVRKLQQDLVSLGHSVGSYGADGSFGNGTRSAVLSFQRKYGLKQDGFAGKATLAKMNQLIAAKNKPVVTKPVSTGRVIHRVQIGAYGDKDNAENMVRELKSKGYEPIIKTESR